MKLVYFAWVRERIGRPEEVLDPPPEVATAGELVAWLKSRGEGYADAFADEARIRVAVDRLHAKPETSVRNAAEVAFFPPMTGG